MSPCCGRKDGGIQARISGSFSLPNPRCSVPACLETSVLMVFLKQKSLRELNEKTKSRWFACVCYQLSRSTGKQRNAWRLVRWLNFSCFREMCWRVCNEKEKRLNSSSRNSTNIVGVGWTKEIVNLRIASDDSIETRGNINSDSISFDDCGSVFIFYSPALRWFFTFGDSLSQKAKRSKGEMWMCARWKEPGEMRVRWPRGARPFTMEFH